MGGRREVSIIFYRPVTRSDLKQERSLSWECLNIFATGCSYVLSYKSGCNATRLLLRGFEGFMGKTINKTNKIRGLKKTAKLLLF